MNAPLTPEQFEKLVSSYTLSCLGKHDDMHALKQNILDAYTALSRRLPLLEPHARPHADLIKAWADGAEIECWYPSEQIWLERPSPAWCPEYVYRIKRSQ